jgi:hypothetical protein
MDLAFFPDWQITGSLVGRKRVEMKDPTGRERDAFFLSTDLSLTSEYAESAGRKES